MKFKFIICILYMLSAVISAFSQSNPLLVGVWGTSINDNAKFEITADSIYYVDYFKSYKYNSTADSIFIHLDGYNYRSKYTVTTDSLFLNSNNKTTKFVRFP